MIGFVVPLAIYILYMNGINLQYDEFVINLVGTKILCTTLPKLKVAKEYKLDVSD